MCGTDVNCEHFSVRAWSSYHWMSSAKYVGRVNYGHSQFVAICFSRRLPFLQVIFQCVL